MVESGLRPIEWGEAESPFIYKSLEETWIAQASAGPIVRVIDAVGEAVTRETVLDAFKDSVQKDGSVRHENVFRWVIAEPMS